MMLFSTTAGPVSFIFSLSKEIENAYAVCLEHEVYLMQVIFSHYHYLAIGPVGALLK